MPKRSARRRIQHGAGTTDSRWFCDQANKRRYPDKRAAERAKRTIVNGHPERDELPLRTYECDQCKGWHLTSWETPNG
jgi:hypothetical protein